MLDIDFRIKLAIAKGRNIIYYRERDTRVRCQYIHIIREFRTQLVQMLNEIPKDHVYRKFIINLISVIHPKVESKQCVRAILKMKKVYTYYGIPIE